MNIIIIVFFSIIVVYLNIIKKRWKTKLNNTNLKKKLIIFGHRGAPVYARENTLLCFKKAIEQGVDGIELDVQKSKDNYLFLYHDEYLIDKKTKIKNNNKKTIKKIQGKQTLNTLEEIEPLLKKIKILNIEIKSTSIKNNNIEKDVIDFIIKNKIINKTIVSSFNPIVLYNIKNKNKNIKTGYLYTQTEDVHWMLKTKFWANIVRPDTFHVNIKNANQKLIKWSKEKKLPLFVYTVNTKKEYLYIKKLGVQGVFTDDPKKIKFFIKKF